MHSIRTHFLALSTCLALSTLLALAGCGGDDEAESEASSEGAAAEGAATETPAAEQPPAAAPAGPCPAATALTIHGVDRSPHLDGVATAFAPTTAFADVTLGRSADLVFASYTIEASPQFGMSAPTGNPNAPEGGLIFQISVTGDSNDLAIGEYAEENGAAGRVSTTTMYRGSSRVIPLADHRVNITEMTDDHICGELIPEEGATWPSVSGSFRIDAV